MRRKPVILKRSEGTKQKHSNIVYEINADKSFFYVGAVDTVWTKWSLTDPI
jgi:hypothetical protein